MLGVRSLPSKLYGITTGTLAPVRSGAMRAAKSGEISILPPGSGASAWARLIAAVCLLVVGKVASEASSLEIPDSLWPPEEFPVGGSEPVGSSSRNARRIFCSVSFLSLGLAFAMRRLASFCSRAKNNR